MNYSYLKGIQLNCEQWSLVLGDSIDTCDSIDGLLISLVYRRQSVNIAASRTPAGQGYSWP